MDPKPLLNAPHCLPQLQLLGFSPCLKGQETDSNRYGIFGQQPSQMMNSSSHGDEKENVPEVSVAVTKDKSARELVAGYRGSYGRYDLLP